LVISVLLLSGWQGPSLVLQHRGGPTNCCV